MKKFLSLLLITVGVFTLAGCESKSNESEKKLTCTNTTTITDGVKADLRYEVNYKGDYVTTVKSTEKVISNQESYLEAYKTQVESIYSPYKDVKYYDYDVTIKDDTMTSVVTIDYSKIDIDKLIEIDSNNSSLIKDGKVKLADIQAVYESIGATCK